ncbi:glycosyltransferase [Vibrio cyclitrophicus]
MKVVLLAGASSIHTIRWANGLNAAGIDVHVISQHPPLESMHQNVTLHLVPFHGVLGYFMMVPAVKKLLGKIKPDLVNAHYASGYATTARLVGYHPWLLSVWGSDVYDFPYFSPLHKYWVNSNLHSADKIASTSHCMAKQTHSLTQGLGEIDITPFGVDIEYYKQKSIPLEVNEPVSRPFVIGTVKLMAHKYGIDILLESFALLKNQLMSSHPDVAKDLRLRLVGDGPQTGELAELAEQLNITQHVQFVGRVNHLEVPDELAKLDIYVALSRLDSESFGVAIVEASAANRPVVVSDAGGLPEVVLDGITGLVVPKENPQAAANALESLVLNPELRVKMANAGRQHVQENYSWDNCIENMLVVYRKTVSDYKAQ